MLISKPTLDDLLKSVFEQLISKGSTISPSRDPAIELSGVLLELTNPRARLSRSEIRGKIFSCLGELFWYLSGTNSLKFIEYYIAEYAKESDDNATIYGGYGPRIFDFNGINQFQNVINLLSKNPYSRRAVIQIFSAADITHRRTEIPCTCYLQFLVRDNQLHLFVTMRSSDAYLGLPHDIFAFTMLQEIVARIIQKDVGTYKHFAGSLHMYDKHRQKAERYIGEGFQSSDLIMPEMPIGDPRLSLKKIMVIEKKLRTKRPVNIASINLKPYWKDIARMFEVFAVSKQSSIMEMRRISGQMLSEQYSIYIEERIDQAAKSRRPQKELPF